MDESSFFLHVQPLTIAYVMTCILGFADFITDIAYASQPASEFYSPVFKNACIVCLDLLHFFCARAKPP